MSVVKAGKPDESMTGSSRIALSLPRLTVPYHLIFAVCLVTLASAVLIWNTQIRVEEFRDSQYQLARNSVTGVVDLISQNVETLRKSVQLLAERERFLLRELVRDPENTDAYEALVMIIKNEIPQAVAITIADAEGIPYITDFDGYILDVCRTDIRHFARDQHAPDLVIHPNPEAYHFDIMVHADIGFEQKMIFFVSFKPEMIADILLKSHLYQHELLLVNSTMENLVEITQSGARTGLQESDFYLSEQQQAAVLSALPVEGSKWILLDLPYPELFSAHASKLWLETFSIILAALVFSAYMTRQLSRSENRLRNQNIALRQQAAELSYANTAIEQERQEVLDLLERMNEGYFLLQRDWTILRVNSLARTVFEDTKQNLIGVNFWDTFPELAGIYHKLNHSIQKQESGRFGIYYPPTDRWFEFDSYPFVHGTALFVRDITEHRHYEQEIESKAQRLKAIFDSALEGIVTINEQGRIESVNNAAMGIFGFSCDELIGKSINMLIPEPHRLQHNQYIRNYLISGQQRFLGKTNELEGTRKDGSKVPLEITLGEVKVQNQRLFTAILRDISSRKQAQAQAETAWRAKLDAESASNAKTAFLANMSHEIRTPLTAIIGFADSLLLSGQSKEERLAAIKTIIRSSNHLLELINDILDISKIEAGKIETDISLMPLPQLISEVSALVGNRAREKGLQFVVSLRTPIPVTIQSDYLRLKQILINLVSNAVKFTEKGFVQLEVAADPDAQQLQFDVIDTGIGIDPDSIDRIFDKFAQADVSTTRKYGGTGLGLSLSRQLAQMLGGDISVSSQPASGSVFSVVIKTGDIDQVRRVSSINMALTMHDEQQKRTAVLVSGKVLLVEDNEDNQRLIRMYLEKMGADVTVAENGEIAVNLARHTSYDLIFMDMQMPVMDGMEAVSILRREGIAIPVVALTANALQEDRERCLQAGFDDFMTKPVNRQILAAAVCEYLSVIDTPQQELPPVYSSLIEEEPEFADVVEKFVAGLDRQQAAIDNAVAARNWPQLKSIVHDLKGTAGGMGFSELSALAAEMEFQLINEDHEQVHLLCRDLQSMFFRIRTGSGQLPGQ